MRNDDKSSGKIPVFASEAEEAEWWASADGRDFLRSQPLGTKPARPAGSKLVAKFTKAASIQIALRLPSPDLAKAKEIAERKGIGYQTLLKMLVHEGLQREERRLP
jgi:predicted DNA binding CopG/RHH family protein